MEQPLYDDDHAEQNGTGALPGLRVPERPQSMNEQDDNISFSAESQQSHTPRTKVSLPDIDDNSMNAVFTYIDFYQKNLAWSFISDSFFLVGGILYVVLSIVDWCESHEQQSPLSENRRTILETIAPLAYVFNSAIDIQWSRHEQRLRKKKTQLQHQFLQRQLQQEEDAVRTEAFIREIQDVAASHMEWICRYAAHRRTLLAAVTFGIAAILDFLDLFIDSDICGALSVHAYLVSAIVCVSGERDRPWFTRIKTILNSSYSQPEQDQYQEQEHQQDQRRKGTIVSPTIIKKLNIWNSGEILEDAGDLLFLIGSLLDATLLDLGLEHPFLAIVSSLLWLMDACLYLLADFVMSKRERNPNALLDESFVFV